MSLVTNLARKSIAYASGVAQQHALGSMNSLVVIERSGGYDEVDREYDPTTLTTVYDNPEPGMEGTGWFAGVTPTQGPITMELGDEVEHYDSINLYLPHDMPMLAKIGDMVTIVITPDVDLAGRLFKVVSAEVGGRIYASNHFVCQGIAPSPVWGS